MPEKRTRRTRAELREMMLTAGKDVLFTIEPTLGFEQLTYSTVFQHLETEYDQKVTIGSVHERIWKNQRDFQLAVIADALRDPLAVAPDDALERAADVITNTDISTPAARRYALQSAVRLSSYHWNAPTHAREIDLAHIVRFRLWALGPDHSEAEGFTEAITDIRTRSIEGYANVVRMIMKFVGVRVRPQAGDTDEVVHTIALLGNATMVGLQTDVLELSETSRLIPSGPNGELEEWFPDSIALWAYVQAMFELEDEGLTNDERRL